MYNLIFWAFAFAISGNQDQNRHFECPKPPEKIVFDLFRQVAKDEINANHVKSNFIKSLRGLGGWDTTSIKLNITRTYSRDSTTYRDGVDDYSNFIYIYRNKDINSLFSKEDKEYVECQIRTSPQGDVMPSVSNIKFVSGENRNDSDYVAYSMPLFSRQFNYAVLLEMRPVSWLEASGKFTHSMRILYYKRIALKWTRFNQTGIFY